MSSLHFEIEGGYKVVPLNWFKVAITATYGGNGINGDVESEAFEFANEDAETIDYLINEVYGYFVGVPAKLVVKQDNITYVVWDGFFNQADESYEHEDGKYYLTFQELEGRDSLRRMFSGLTYTEIHSKTPISFESVKYSIQKRYTAMEYAMAVIVIYNMFKAIRDSIKATADTIAEIAGISSSSTTGTIGAVILAVLKAAILAAWTAALILITIRLVRDVVASIIPPKGTHKAMSLSNALNAAFGYYGYSLDTTITDINNLLYLPSMRGINSANLFKSTFSRAPEIKEGIPNSGDYGYIVEDMLLLVAELFNAKFYLDGNKIRVINEFDESLYEESNYILPSTYVRKKGNNASEAVQTKIFSFLTDPSDEYTQENYTGVSYEVKTEPITIEDRRRYLVKGLKRTSIQMARGHKKPRLTPAEKVLNELIQVADEFSSIFGGSVGVEKPEGYVGKLMVSQNNHSIPKLLDRNNLTVDAQYFMDTYYNGDSFVNGRAQYEVFKVIVPMDLETFKELAKNPYFRTEKGEKGKFQDDLNYVFGEDKAEGTVRIQKVYDRNLKEIKYKP